MSRETPATDLELHARRLIEFVELGWDSACLAFHSHPRVVRTHTSCRFASPCMLARPAAGAITSRIFNHCSRPSSGTA